MMPASENQDSQRVHEVVLYHYIDTSLIYPFTREGMELERKAEEITRQHGCRLEFRRGKFKYDYRTNATPPGYPFHNRYVAADGSILSAVLVGADVEKLRKARTDILMKIGSETLITSGWPVVGKELYCRGE